MGRHSKNKERLHLPWSMYDVQAMLAERSLRHFLKQAWPVIEPQTPLIPGWHLDAMCDHLEAVTLGQILALLLLVPPRHSKSTIVSVMWNAWEWIRWPGRRYLCSSYSNSLALRDSVKCRRLIQSDWYQRNWADRYQITGDQNAKERYENNKGGYRLTRSVNGPSTGEGGDRVICLHPDTLIQTDEGPIAIQQLYDYAAFYSKCVSINRSHNLRVKVAGWDHARDQMVYQWIKQCECTGPRPFVSVTFSNKAKLKLTRDHPIYVAQKGYVPAGELKSGWPIISESGDETLRVAVVQSCESPSAVFNIKTQTGNYFANGVLVHNCDDPHNIKQIESDTVRQGAVDWWDQVMSTRINDPRIGARVVIMQRSHEYDLAGHLIEQGGYEVLRLPVEYEPKFHCTTSIGFQDPRTEEGELLCPARFTRADVNALKRSLRSYGSAAQLQQRPAPLEGGVVKRTWWRYYRERPKTFDEVLLSLDCTFKALDESDFVVGQAWGRVGPDKYLLDQMRGRMTFTKTVNAFLDLVDRWPDAHAKLIEDKANGSAVLDVLSSRISGLIAVEPQGGKLARAQAISPEMEAGNVYIPDPALNPWVNDYIEEWALFPNGAHDDQVDATSQALLRFSRRKRKGFAPLISETRVSHFPDMRPRVDVHQNEGAAETKWAPIFSATR